MAGILDTLSVDQQLELIYIGYFDRAADGGGFNFWSGQYAAKAAAGANTPTVVKDIANSFGASTIPETVALYPFLSTSSPDYSSPIVLAQLGAFIDSVYQNLFNRAPDAEGKAYWTDQIKTGAIALGSAILVIANGAQAPDSTVLTNKIAAAIDFTTDTSVAGQGFTDPLLSTFKAAAVEVLNGVTADPATVTAAAAETDAFVSGGSTGSTFTLTTGVDNGPAFTGGAGNDTFNAPFTTAATFTALDALDGGAGNDTLSITNTGAFTVPGGATVANIETVNVIAGGAVTLDTQTNFSGVQTISAVAGADAVDIDTKANATSVTVTGGTTVAVDDNGTAATDVLASVSISGNTGAATLTSDKLTSVSISNTDQNTTVANTTAGHSLAAKVNTVTGGTLTDGEATSLSIEATGKNTLNAAAAAKATSLTITGAGTLAVTTSLEAGTAVKTGATIDATGNSGGVTVSLATNDATQIFKGGSGKDSVSTGSVLTTGSADGGTGTDTLSVTNSTHLASAALGAKYTNFETLGVTNGVSVDLDNIAGITAIQITDGAATTAVVDLNDAQAGAITLKGADGAFTVAMAASAAAKATITVDDGDTTLSENNVTNNSATLTTSNVETLNIVAVDDADIDFSAATNSGLKFVNLSGAGDHNITTGNLATSGFKVDGSTATGILTVNASSFATNAVTITGGSQGDTLTGSGQADTISGGAGADQISGGAGADKLTGGAGADNFTLAPATASAAATGFAFSAAVPGAALSTASMDKILDFTASDTITLTGLVTGTTLLNNATSLGADNTGSVALVRGTYVEATQLFQASLTGTDSLFVYDTDGTTGAGAIHAVVLVGYVDAGTTDTISAAGLFTGVA